MTKKTPNAASQSLADCFDAAQREADRLFGNGPVTQWRPAFRWQPWAVAAVLVAIATLALLWPWRTALQSEPAPAAAAEPVALVAVAPTVPQVSPPGAAPDAAVAPAAPGCGEAGCAAPFAQAPMVVANPAPLSVLPGSLEAWALDPQPLVAAAESDPSTGSLVNTPVIPDEHDPTPADETSPDDEPVEAPAE